MIRALPIALLSLAISPSVAPAAVAEEAKPAPSRELESSDVSALKFRSIGPALMSGRIADIAIDPVKPNTWYVAVGSGNLWKTENAGTTWTPIFDDKGSYSLGCVSIDPNDRHTIWVGTGENVSGRHVGYGDGVYVSRDGGQSFTNVGLEKSEHLSKILIDPRDSDTVYVAAQGPLWSPGGERGLFKTTDGGETWTPVLTKGKWTGVTDVVMDPTDPDVLYAATHQRHRTVWALIDGGPESGIFKSTDAGETWTELKRGLPGADKGKMSLGVSPQQPSVVYATIELAGREGGIWRSENGGASWTKMSDYTSGGTGPHYYQEIYVDPHRFDVFYHANVRLGRTTDGGKTFEVVESRNKHVDNHAVAFHPTDPDFLLVGCDGGLYRSWDQGETYEFCANLPVTQFYKVDVDYDEPFYHVVGGTQDNNTQYGPTRTNNNIGIRNADWRITIGGDGHDCAIDPENPDIIYSESQQGYLRRFDRRTGESIDIRPRPEAGEEELRYNWDSPILISPHSHTRLYFGSKKLHRSDDRGDSWTTISPDLSRNLDRFTLPIMERVWSIDAIFDLYAMSQYGNITSISESPLEAGLIYVGTDDGLIQVTEDGGETWRKIDKVYGVPEFAFVNDVKADLHDANTVYAVFDDHKTGDFEPYVARSRDRGRTWDSIASDLPERHLVWRIEQDHEVAELLFVGTEFGVFYSRDAGAHWIKLAGTPNIPFRDLAIQRRENDLVGATFGRGFYVLDDYAPLREIDAELLKEQELALFPVRKALLYIVDRPLGRPKGAQGDSYYAADNPPYGAVFTYYLRDDLETREARRKEQEKKVKEAGGDNLYPGWDELKKEEREEDPVLIFTIEDDAGDVVRRITGPTKSGLHRIAWDLRYAGFTGRGEQGPLVTPGTYTVSATRRVDDVETGLGEPREFEVVAIGASSLPRQDREETLAFQMEVGALQKDVIGTTRKLDEVLAQLAEIKQVVTNTRSLDRELYDDARALELELLDIQEQLTGDRTRSRRSQTAPLSVMQRVQTALSGTLRQTHGPTETHRRQYEIGREQFESALEDLGDLLEE
ncbi:MAG: glycosyl hydrolase, partial [Phycisphaerales bacterium]|nr:glycosyl hydrolase [Phycisphaerales bacterium]